MEANVMVQQKMAAPVNLAGNRPPNPVSASRTPAAAPAASPVRNAAPAVAPPPVAPPADLSFATGVNILNAHPRVSQGATENLVTSEFPLPLSDGDVSDSTITRYVSTINQMLEPAVFKLNFGVHEDTNMVTVQIVDTNTEEVIRELPPESRLDTMARIQEFVGLLFDEEG
jgi:flagellar protein FlaG